MTGKKMYLYVLLTALSNSNQSAKEEYIKDTGYALDAVIKISAAPAVPIMRHYILIRTE